MPKISPTDWRTQLKIYERFGCTYVRKKGSHHVLNYSGATRAVVIPEYDEIDLDIIKNNMRTVGMSREEYFALLDEILAIVRFSFSLRSAWLMRSGRETKNRNYLSLGPKRA